MIYHLYFLTNPLAHIKYSLYPKSPLLSVSNNLYIILNICYSLGILLKNPNALFANKINSSIVNVFFPLVDLAWNLCSAISVA